MVLAGRLDRLTFPRKNNYSYHSVVTYTPHPNHLLRFVSANAHAGSNISSTFINTISFSTISSPPFQHLVGTLKGNKELDLNTQQSFELGYRLKLFNGLNLDLTLFRTRTKQFSWFVQKSLDLSSPPVIQFTTKGEVLPHNPIQQGLTLQIDWNTDKVTFRPFITFQHTRIKNFTPYLVDPAVDSINNITQTTHIDHQATPGFYGGFVLNYQPFKRLNINLNSYFMDKHIINVREFENQGILNPGIEINNEVAIKRTFLANINIRYNVSPQITLFGNFRNLFSGRFQHFQTDIIKPSYLFGFNFDLD